MMHLSSVPPSSVTFGRLADHNQEYINSFSIPRVSSSLFFILQCRVVFFILALSRSINSGSVTTLTFWFNIQYDIFKCLVLSDWELNTQRYLIYKDIKMKKSSQFSSWRNCHHRIFAIFYKHYWNNYQQLIHFYVINFLSIDWLF